MGKLIWNRGGAASPSLAVSYVLGSGGCGGYRHSGGESPKRSASEIELKLGWKLQFAKEFCELCTWHELVRARVYL